MIVLVVGAGGFVGRGVCAELERRGHRVRAVARRPLVPGFPAAEQAVVYDVEALTDWTKLLRGVGAVVYLAARVHVLKETQDTSVAALYRGVNVDVPISLARAAAREKAATFVYASTVKVHGEKSVGGVSLCHDSPLLPDGPYAETKAEAEELLRELLRGTNTSLAIIVLPLVYGPRVRANFLRLIKLALLAHVVPMPLGSVANRRSFAYLGNVADVVALAVEQKADGRFMVDDGAPVSTPDLLREICGSLGTKPRLFRFPPKILRLVAEAVGQNATATRMLDSLSVDSIETRTRLGWRPRWSRAEGLAETIRWYRHPASYDD